MGMINRAALIVRPRQPFLEWVNGCQTPGKPPTIYTLEDIRHDPSVYLIPNFFTVREHHAWVEEEFDYFFDDQLEAWWTDERDWPKRRDAKMFREWFDLEILTGVEDTVDEPITDDDPD